MMLIKFDKESKVFVVSKKNMTASLPNHMGIKAAAEEEIKNALSPPRVRKRKYSGDISHMLSLKIDEDNDLKVKHMILESAK